MSLFRSVFVEIRTYYQSNKLIRGKYLSSNHCEANSFKEYCRVKKKNSIVIFSYAVLVSTFFPPIFKNLNHASPPITNEYDLINKDFNLLNKRNSFCNKKCKLPVTRKKVI